ncbi:MAG: response regulator transcription factor [Oscillospiraceae bacterium]|jgi:DNA-binding response OmpR family regulator|nr:response regulator transcription factor [Oscillospiraceae bacterium]
MHILLVEDDAAIAAGLIYALEQEGYAVTHFASVAQATAAGGDFALAILDLGLPDGSGFDVAQGLACPFLFLTAVDDEANTVRGFDLGADDYVTKPFRLRELLARVKSVLRRGVGGSDALTLGAVTIDTKAAKVTKNGADIELTALEYKLLLTFAQHRGQTLSRGQLLSSLWDNAGNFVEDNTLTVYVKRLREKLGEGVIETVRGLGYRCS